jgi:hypothetical protein
MHVQNKKFTQTFELNLWEQTTWKTFDRRMKVKDVYWLGQASVITFWVPLTTGAFLVR